MGNLLPLVASANTPELAINFDPSQLFQYANIIISAMMPVAYITIGISLGYTIVRALKNAIC